MRKIINEFDFEGIPFQTRICKQCKEEFDIPTSSKDAKCRECKLGLKKPLRKHLRKYKKNEKN